MIYVALGGVLALWLIRYLWHYIIILKYFQLHEYDNLRYLLWAIKNWYRLYWKFDGVIFLQLMMYLLFQDRLIVEISVLLLTFTFLLGFLFDGLQERGRKAREVQRLVFTARVKRLIATGLLLYILSILLSFRLYLPILTSNLILSLINSRRLYYVLFSLWGIGQLTPLIIVISNLILFPIEEALRYYYLRSAQRILEIVKPFVIGITGSYGKTTTKEILAHLLSTKYAVLKTPKSYNTLMGICKVIREELKIGHEYFIVEMGAYKRGEIARICDLVKPRIGILTAVGPQHLERFKTIENVAKAKFELIESLPSEGVAIFNADDPIVQKLSFRTRTRTLRYGLANDRVDLDLTAKDLEFGVFGTNFVISQKDGTPQQVKMRLLGKHNVSNALAAILAAMECGLTYKEIVPSLAIMPPFEHRLQPVRTPNQVTFIDDSYNSNPVGAKIALEVLASFSYGRKFLVTPGMVELGDLEVEENYRFGKRAAEICDFIFLIGKKPRIDPILNGVIEKGFPTERVYLCDNAKEARQRLEQILQPGDVVLFENDLPDIY